MNVIIKSKQNTLAYIITHNYLTPPGLSIDSPGCSRHIHLGSLQTDAVYRIRQNRTRAETHEMGATKRNRGVSICSIFKIIIVFYLSYSRSRNANIDYDRIFWSDNTKQSS